MSRGRHRRMHHHYVLAVLAPVAVLVLVIMWTGRSGDNRSSSGDEGPGAGGSSTAQSTPAAPSHGASTSKVISLTAHREAAAPLTAVRLTGEYAEAEPGTLLHLQLRSPDRGWVSFPLPTAVDDGGRFLTYVELGRRGTNVLRVIEPESDVTSNSVAVRIR